MKILNYGIACVNGNAYVCGICEMEKTLCHEYLIRWGTLFHMTVFFPFHISRKEVCLIFLPCMVVWVYTNVILDFSLSIHLPPVPHSSSPLFWIKCTRTWRGILGFGLLGITLSNSILRKVRTKVKKMWDDWFYFLLPSSCSLYLIFRFLLLSSSFPPFQPACLPLSVSLKLRFSR